MKDLLTNRNSWNAIAASYDEVARRTLTPFSAEAVRWAELDDTDVVLDVASGPGTTTMIAAKIAKSVQAVDFSSEMIALLRKNTDGQENVSSMVGDGQRLMFDNESFSVAFSMFGLIFFPSPVAGLRELHRVLRPGGRVLISSWVPMLTSPMMKPLADALRHAAPPPPDQAPPAPFPFDSTESLTEGLREGGFEEVEVKQVTPSVPVESAEHYWDEAQGNIFVTHLREQAGPEWEAISTRALEHLRESLAGVESLDMPGFIGRGRKSTAPSED